MTHQSYSKLVPLLLAALLLLSATSADARTVHLRATPQPQTADLGRFPKTAVLETAVFIGKRLINPTLNAGGGCVVGWSWRSLVVRANSCRPVFRLKYVAFSRSQTFRFEIRRIG